MKEDLKEDRRKFNEIIGNNVKNAIIKKGIMQMDVAKMLGVTKNTFYKWTCGKIGIDTFYLFKIAKFLDLKFFNLFEGLIEEEKDNQLTDEEIKKIREILK